MEEDGNLNWAVLASRGDFVFRSGVGEARLPQLTSPNRPSVGVTTTANLGHFFEGIGRPVTLGYRPDAAELLRICSVLSGSPSSITCWMGSRRGRTQQSESSSSKRRAFTFCLRELRVPCPQFPLPYFCAKSSKHMT